MTHWFKNTLDYKMGLMIIIGGVIGTIIGIITFTFFKITFYYFFQNYIPYLFILSELESISGKYILLGCFDDCQKTSIGIPPLGAKKP